MGKSKILEKDKASIWSDQFGLFAIDFVVVLFFKAHILLHKSIWAWGVLLISSEKMQGGEAGWSSAL